jgi:hypothetical protein
MKAAAAQRIEKIVDSVASALFATAVGYAAHSWLGPRVGDPLLALESGAATAIALLLSHRMLSVVRPDTRQRPLAIFDVREIEEMPAEEEPLELVDIFEPSEEPLDLHDILAELGSESRVVRLFDRAAMPTPGELKDRIDGRFDEMPDAVRSADAAQALHEALAELRRSLR